MQSSPLVMLQEPEIIVLAAGHGGADPGAVNGRYKERDQAIVIVDRMAVLLAAHNIKVEVAPHTQDTHETIPWLNAQYDFHEAWVLEIHRDSAPGLNLDDASRRCGVYYGNSPNSKKVGAFVRNAFLGNGAHPNSWSRKHTEARSGSLGWITQTKQAAHLLELGFMQGKNDDAHLQWLAKLAAIAVYEAFTGNDFPA